ncbi:hypothetical protein LSAT2_021636 [Lamellibrachia satsuma]|nr:hypothetical protein LSAT2_021636 [Lamellibrachia satsuma]
MSTSKAADTTARACPKYFGVTCPPIGMQSGEIYTDTTCTSSTKNYMDTCEMTCSQGYILTGSTGVRRCTENGNWSNVATCEGVTCPPIGMQSGEIYTDTTCTSSTKNYMDTCEMTCIQGYRLTGSTGVRRCTENGNWSNVATCEGVTCPPIGMQSGEIYTDTTCTSSTKNYKDTCEMTCIQGYRLTGSTGVRRCTENGNWSNVATCEGVTCPPIGMQSGEIYTDTTCTSSTKNYKDTCEMTCIQGYRLTGSTGVRRCTENGNWSNVATCEVVTCPPIGMQSGEIYTDTTCTSSTKNYKDTCEMTCIQGYRLTGNTGVRRCTENGNWTNVATCEERLCPTVNHPAGSVLLNGAAPYTPGTTLQYKCATGFELTGGHLEQLCKLDGQWAGEVPQCTEVVAGDQDANKYNTTIVYRCYEGHELLWGDLSRTCQSSKTWSGEAPVCRIVSCGPPAPVAHATASTNELDYMTNITYTCLPGFVPATGGQWTRQCQVDRRWSGTPPLCLEVLCRPPTDIANTSLTTNGVRVNDTATYSCLPGFRLEAGNLTKVCGDDGRWQNDDPECTEVHCGSPLDVTNASYSMRNGDMVGGKVTYTCNHGYERKAGEGFSRCQLDGKWTKPSLICEEVTCGTPPPVKYARVTDSCVSRGCVVHYRCDVGYESNEVESECLVDGDWTRVSLNCTRVKCGDVTGVGSRVTDQTGAHYEDAVTLECLPGHHRESGSLVMTCLAEGVWSGTPLVCAQTTCKAPTNIVGGVHSVGNLTVGSKVTYQPEDRYRLVSGDLVRTCGEDEHWDGKQPVFEEITCPSIQVGSDSKVVPFVAGVVVGARVTYSCVAGYNISTGSNRCDCLITGNWSCEQPTCTKVNCGQPPSVAHARNEEQGTRYLDRATYTCDSGYYTERPHVALVCSKRGVWEGDEIVCTEITCPTPELPSMATYNITSLTYKSRVLYTCHQGYSIASGDEELTCQSNGTWSGTTPTCEKVECPRPPYVVNTTWSEDKKSLRQRRIIYRCLPRYKFVSGQLSKECGPGGRWIGVDPVCEADKGRATVVMDKTQDEKKVREILNDEKTYFNLKSDPTAKYKRKLIAILTRLKREGAITELQYFHP